MRFFPAFVASAFLTTVASHALADLAPPAGYVESCTLEKQSGPGLECLPCRAFYGNRDHCSKSLASYGFAQKCRARGASSWSEVWCRAASPTAAKVPATVVEMLPHPNGKPPAGEETAAPSAAPPAASAEPAPVASEAPPPPAPAPSAASAAPAPEPIPAAPPKKAGACAMSPGVASGSSGLFLMGALLFGGQLRRRSRRAR